MAPRLRRPIDPYPIILVAIMAIIAIAAFAFAPSCASDEVMVRGFGFQPYVCVKGHG